ncbi:MAG: hypothetical protein JW763_05655 [candidate division Zixibacteria bacterium]|nr:hypothetical protein [candidate division Zixibacteria bacterium]
MSFERFVTHLTGNWQPFVRFLLLLLGVGMIVWIVIVSILVTTQWVTPGIKVSVESSGAFVISTGINERTAVFLLTPQGDKASPWINSGIQIRKDQKIRVTASGRVCLAMHHMIKSAFKDIPPPVPWNGPAGIDTLSELPPITHRMEESVRSQFRIAPHLFQGRVIGTIATSQPPIRPDSILNIGDFYEGEAYQTGTLWLTVNEIWHSSSLPEAYTPGSPEEFKANIVENKYWNVWFDDNSGAFLVTVELGS